MAGCPAVSSVCRCRYGVPNQPVSMLPSTTVKSGSRPDSRKKEEKKKEEPETGTSDTWPTCFHTSNKSPENVIILSTIERHQNMTPPPQPSYRFSCFPIPSHPITSPLSLQPSPSVIMALEQGQDICLAHLRILPTINPQPQRMVAYHMRLSRGPNLRQQITEAHPCSIPSLLLPSSAQ